MKVWGGKVERWVDECKLAFDGVLQVLKNWRYVALSVLLFLFFGMLLSFLNNGSTELRLLFSNTSLGEKASIMLTVLGQMFGADGMSFSRILTLVIALFQALAWSLLLFMIKAKKKNKADKKRRLSEIEEAGVGASLALLGTGCSGCGVSLIAPILGTIFSSSGHLIASITSWVFTLAALILSFFTVKKLGFDGYVIHASERRKYARKD
ncbi:MAG: hypothetical protein LBE03_00975 [Candidatus Nomurabacteria bacterium]|nr:hypothetical protein [Candidatus Nomurabacteria bacterium]